ncbi:MAG: hypothetical protein AB7K71_00355 [Polyangiaceae bacterium]
MTSNWDEAIAALEPLHEALEELNGHGSWASLVEELRTCLVAVARAPAPSSDLHPSLARATQLTTTLVVSGVWSRERVEALRPAFNACVGRDGGEWAAERSAQADSWMGFRASRRRPRVNVLPPFCEPEPAYDIPADPIEFSGLVVDHSVVEALPVEALGSELVEQCLEDLSLVGRHRWERFLSESGNEEQTLLRLGDAFCVVGEAAPRHLRAWWQDHAGSDPYQAFAIAYALGVCAGAQHLELLRSCLEELHPTDSQSSCRAADALQLVARPERRPLVEHWRLASHPVIRATALELGTRRLDGPAWLSVEEVGASLADPNPPVVLAALRGLARLGAVPEGLVPQVHQLMLGPLGEDVAVEAARCFALCGRTAPLIALRQDGRAYAAWGERTLEVLVWFGSTEDLGLLQHLLKRAPQSAYTLDAVARFGVVETYAYLLHALEQEELADDALKGLVTLLGPLPADAEPLQVTTWQAQLKRVKPKSGVRYRRGQPWQPRVVASEIAAGHLARREVQVRTDELVVRLGGLPQPDLTAFGDELDGQLSDLLSGLGNLNARFNAGSYDCYTRDRKAGGAS